MKTLNIEKNEKGFTLIEIMIVLAIIGILSAIAVPSFLSYRDKAYDTTARADLKNMMKFLNFYYLENDTYPATSDDLLAAGFNLSKDVRFTKYDLGTFGDGQPTVHIHIEHSSSSNYLHANYPKEGDEIEIR